MSAREDAGPTDELALERLLEALALLVRTAEGLITASDPRASFLLAASGAVDGARDMSARMDAEADYRESMEGRS